MRALKSFIPLALLVGVFLLHDVTVQTQAQLGSWGPVLDWGYQAKHMAALPNGKILVFRTGDTARVWDPATGNFLMTPSFFGDLHCAAQLMLSDGRVIVVGGQMNSTHIGTKVTSIFDFRTNTWTEGTKMTYARWYPTAAILGNGDVLVTTGDDDHGKRVGIPEVYNPNTNTWRQLTGADRTQQLYTFLYQLPNGKVYEAAPDTSTFYLDVNGTGSWSAGPASQWSTNSYSESGALYGPGKILRTGGGDPATARTAVIDMTVANPQWRETSPMQFARRRMNLVILSDGSLLAVGGTRSSDNESSAVLQAEIWDPVTERWSTVASMSEARMYHSTALLLPDGRVVSGGGEATGRNHAQIYSPPYLFKGARPVISASPDAVAFGTSFFIATPNPGNITSVALLRPGAPTHALDFNQRYLPLNFTVASGGQTGLTVSAPPDGNHAPPGYYMLIVKNSNGVPSVASWVRLDENGAPTPGSLSGHITDATTHLGIAGATVQDGGNSTTTDADGVFSFETVAAGQHSITVTASGYAKVTRALTVAAGQAVTADVSLVAPGDISGQVVDLLGAPIPGATITFAGGSTSTGVSGEYTIAGIASGTQSITASATQFVTGTLALVVPPNGSAVGNFTLEIAPSYIGGEVVDVLTNQPILGATVSYYGGSTTTDGLGRYHLPDVTPGPVSVSVAAAGYVGATQEVVVPFANYATSDFDLVPLVAPPSPTAIKTITFEGGLTDPFTGFDKGASGVSLVTSNALKGTKSGTATSGYFEENFAGVDDLYLSFYLRVNTLTSGTPRIMLIQNGGTTAGNLLLTSTGLRLRTGSSTIGADSGPLTPGQVYRVGVRQKKGTGSNALLQAFLAQGDAPFTTPFASLTTGTWKTQPSRLRLGGTNGIVNLTVDDVRLDSGAMPGAIAAGPPLSADFSASLTEGTAPLTVAFNSGISTGNVTSWTWDLQNDGTPDSTVANPTAVYHTPGIYSVTLTIADGSTAASKTRTAYITVNAPLPAPPPVSGTLSATLVADAQVSRTSPTKNDGALTTLRTREGDASNLATYHSYLKFDVTGLTGTVTSATLRLYATAANTAGVLVYSATSGWVESTLIWNNRPPLGAEVGSTAAITGKSWVEIPLSTSVFSANQPYTLVVVGKNSQSQYFGSKDGPASQRPQLVLSVTP